jgi:hypothetical protein
MIVNSSPKENVFFVELGSTYLSISSMMPHAYKKESPKNMKNIPPNDHHPVHGLLALHAPPSLAIARRCHDRVIANNPAGPKTTLYIYFV